jgi:hypothetical protein
LQLDVRLHEMPQRQDNTSTIYIGGHQVLCTVVNVRDKIMPDLCHRDTTMQCICQLSA